MFLSMTRAGVHLAHALRISSPAKSKSWVFPPSTALWTVLVTWNIGDLKNMGRAVSKPTETEVVDRNGSFEEGCL